MSWLFSRALVEEYSAATSSGGEPSAPLNVMPTQHKFWRNDKTIDASRLSLFGLTCAVLTENHGEELLMSYLADFHAKTSAQPVKVVESTENEADCGPKCPESFAKLDPNLSMWKTAHYSHLEDCTEFSKTWPRWGLMLDGECWALPMLERPTSENAYGFWPTPTAITPSGGAALCKWGGSGSREKLRKMVTTQELNGPLNPAWVEWLMGWPLGWTDLKPLAMDRFREWQRQHSPCCQDGREEISGATTGADK